MFDVSKQEWMILEALWARSPLFLAEIMRELDSKLNWTHSTYLSYIRKMVSQEYIGFNKVRGSRAYYPIARQDECVEYQRDALLFMMQPGSARMLITELIKNTDMDEAGITELIQLLDSKERTQPEPAEQPITDEAQTTDDASKPSKPASNKRWIKLTQD